MKQIIQFLCAKFLLWPVALFFAVPTNPLSAQTLTPAEEDAAKNVFEKKEEAKSR